MALGEGGQGIGTTFQNVVGGVKKTVGFLRSGVGIIVLKLLLVIATIVLIYILGDVIFDSVGKLLFKSDIGLGTDEYNRNTEFLQNLASSGYDSMVDADQLMKYYAFEYAVLMDEAEYLEEHGVYTLDKRNIGIIDWEKVTRDEWDQLAGRGFQHERKYTEEWLNSIGVEKPENYGKDGGDYELIKGDHENKIELKKNTFHYKAMKNEYTNQESLIPYYRATRTDYYLRYFFELGTNRGDNDAASASNQSISDNNYVNEDNGKKGITFVNNTWTNGTGNDGARDGGNINRAQQNMAVIGSEYHTDDLEDPVTKAIDTGTGGPVHRFEEAKTPANNQEQSQTFIGNYITPTYFSLPLNQANTAALLTADKRHSNGDGNIDLDASYGEQDLFYYRKDIVTNYDVPLRVILDRFLPNASLLSSWRLLTNDGTESAETGSVAEDLVNDIMDVYNDACLTGEEVTTELWLLKDVQRNTKEVDELSTAQSLLVNGTAGGEPVIEYYFNDKEGEETDIKFASYLPKFDSRHGGYESKVNKNAEKSPEQSFGGSLAEDVVDDVKLVLTHYAKTAKVEYSQSTIDSVVNVVRSNISEGGGGDFDPVDDIVIYRSDESGRPLYYCKGVGEGNTDNTIIRNHYGLGGSTNVEIKVSNEPVKHTEVYVGGSQATHKDMDECKVPFLYISYEIQDGLKNTAVILHEGENYYGYIVKDKEQGTFGGETTEDTQAGDEPFKGAYTNDYSFAEIESGELQSTLIWHWEYQNKSGEEKSYESWFVTDAFEGLDYKIRVGKGDQGPEYWGELYTGSSNYPQPNDFYRTGAYQDGAKEEEVFKYVAPYQHDREGDVKDEYVFGYLIGANKEDYVKFNQIYHKNNFTVLRSGDEFNDSVNYTVEPRKEKYIQEKQSQVVSNASMKKETAEDIERNPKAQVTTTRSSGETILTERHILDFKILDPKSDAGPGPIKTTDEFTLYVQKAEERLRNCQMNLLFDGVESESKTTEIAQRQLQDPRTKPLLEQWEVIAWHIYENRPDIWSKWGMSGNPDQEIERELGMPREEATRQQTRDVWPTDPPYRLRMHQMVEAYRYTPYTWTDQYGNVYESEPLDGYGWNDNQPNDKWRMENDIDTQLHAVYPTRVTVQPMSQRIVDKHMPAWFVNSAKYWAGEKEFYNYQIVQGEMKSHDDYRYLLTNNEQAIAIKNIQSEYTKLNWRCNLFAPIFGSRRGDNSGREGDIKLILAEWEEIGNRGIGAADHAIRDLNSLIQYTKGVRQRDESGIENKDSGWAYEPIKDENGEPYVNENSYVYLYIPEEILSYNELTCEAAFWMDRIICTNDDAIYDKENSDRVTSENRMRSRLPLFTWQVVDYDLYDETYAGGGQHYVYALWPFGGQNSRLMHAIGMSAGDGSKGSIGGYHPSVHRGADLFGRTNTAKIFKSVFGRGSKSSDRENVLINFGYGYFDYKANAVIKAKYDGHDVYFEDKNGNRVTNIDTSQYFDSDDSSVSNASNNGIDANKLFGVPSFADILTTFQPSDANAGLEKEKTSISMKLGNKTYNVNGTAAATYVYQAYRTALLLKDKTGEETEKTLRKSLAKEAHWSEIRSLAPGIVRYMGGDAISGFWLEIEHDHSGRLTLYCHLKRYPLVQVGEYVGAGTLLGYEGTTGRSEALHLHLGMKGAYGSKDNPVDYIYPFFAPFWYQEKADEVLEKHSDVFLDSEYFTPARTVYAYGQNGVTIKRDLSSGAFSMGNPVEVLIGSTQDLAEAKDADDYISPTIAGYIQQTCDDVVFEDEPLHTNPDFSDPDFIKLVKKNSGRIHGHFPGGFGGGANFGSVAANEAEIWAVLVELFGNESAAAGVMGNMYAESGLAPGNLENEANSQYGISDEEYTDRVNSGGPLISGYGYGLCQWTGSRHEALVNYMLSNGYSVDDAGGQLEYLVHELTETSESTYNSGFYSYLNGMNVMDIYGDVELLARVGRECAGNNGISCSSDEEYAAVGASEVWLHGFERPRDQIGNQSVRANLSLGVYARNAGSSPSSDSDSDSNTGTKKD